MNWMSFSNSKDKAKKTRQNGEHKICTDALKSECDFFSRLTLSFVFLGFNGHLTALIVLFSSSSLWHFLERRTGEIGVMDLGLPMLAEAQPLWLHLAINLPHSVGAKCSTMGQEGAQIDYQLRGCEWTEGEEGVQHGSALALIWTLWEQWCAKA